jgi:hypothetical protein
LSAAKRSLAARAPTFALHALAAVASGWGLSRALAWRVGLWPALGPRFGALCIALALAICSSTWALAVALSFARRGAALDSAPLAGLRRALVVLVAMWLLMLVAVQPFQRLWFDFALAVSAGVWSGWMLLARSARAQARWHGVLERTLTAACAAIVLLELGLRALALASPRPVLARGDDAPGRFVERFRCKPGELRFGFPCNERGFCDGPFARRGQQEVLVAAIGDSFHVGAVPHAWHFTTVCEEALGVRVDNLGVAGIGPPEYLHLLLEESLPLDPSAVTVSLFVGNDLDYAESDAGLPSTWLRGWFEREGVLLAVVPRRIARLRAERAQSPGAIGDTAALGTGAGAPPALADREALRASLPWLEDPLLEQPSLSSEAYLRLERQRALAICRGEPRSLRAACERLRQMRAACGSVPFGVLLIPDELQVEDELWTAVSSSAGEPLERDLAQRLLTAWLTEEGIPFVDLLPLLREVPPLADGRRHVYHLQDTHFNARGNSVAGKALSALVEMLLQR